jgi:hypothetical protein
MNDTFPFIQSALKANAAFEFNSEHNLKQAINM